MDDVENHGAPTQYRLLEAASACITKVRSTPTVRERRRYLNASKLLSNLHSSMLGAGGAADNQDRLQTELEQYESSLQGGNFTTVKNSEDALLLAVARMGLQPLPVYMAQKGDDTLQDVANKLAADRYTWVTAAKLRAYNECRGDHISTPLKPGDLLLVPPQPRHTQPGTQALEQLQQALDALQVAAVVQVYQGDGAASDASATSNEAAETDAAAVPGAGVAGATAYADPKKQEDLKQECLTAYQHHMAWASIFCWIFHTIKVLTTVLGLAVGSSGIGILQQVKDTSAWQIAAVVMSMVAGVLNGMELVFTFQKRQDKRLKFATRYLKLQQRLEPQPITALELTQVQVHKDQADEDASKAGMFLDIWLWGKACIKPNAI